jgi:hypothetical protein
MDNFARLGSLEFWLTTFLLGKKRKTGYFLLALAVTAALATGANPPAGSPPVSTASTSPAGNSSAQPAAQPMDYPLRLIAEARQSIQGIRDYTCLFVKQERLRGQLQPENLIDMKVRNQPFSVYLRWLKPQNLVGQEACYVTGANNGMLRVHATGIAGSVGFMSVEPTDARVMQNNRHPITDAGIGRLIEKYGQRWEMERQLNKTQVRIGEFDYNQRRCVRVETIHPDNSSGRFYTYRSLVYFDKGTHLPIRVESYDWPKQGGPAGGELIESYSYANLRLNPGLGDEVFKK